MRYDFGGTEDPFDDTITIIDIQDCPEYRKETNGFIFGDLNTILDLPEKATFISISKVLRYITDPYKTKINWESYKNIIENINNNLSLNGSVRLFDYEEYVLPIVDILMNPVKYEKLFNIIGTYKIVEFQRCNYYNDEEPYKWDIVITLQKCE